METKKELNLFEFIPIEYWSIITNYVLNFDMKDKNEEEFNNNFKKMEYILKDMRLSTSIGNKYLPNANKNGLVKLLQSIYQIESKNDARIHFYNQINTLKSIGVETIRFYGGYNDFDESEGIIIPGMRSTRKVLTDGFVKIKADLEAKNYQLYDVEDANYSITTIFTPNDKIRSRATLYTFNGEYPSKSIIEEQRLPDILEEGKIVVPFKESTKSLKMSFK